MKAWEFIKEENDGKKYTYRGEVYEVVYRVGIGTYLCNNNNLLNVGEWLFNADFEEVQDKSKWDRGIIFDDIYYYVNRDGVVSSYTYYEDDSDCDLQNNANVFLSEEKAEEVAREQLLYRLMKRFRDENDECVDWMKDKKTGYFIYKDVEGKEYEINSCVFSRDLHTIYFTRLELAKRCLDEVVKPFFEKQNKN